MRISAQAAQHIDRGAGQGGGGFAFSLLEVSHLARCRVLVAGYSGFARLARSIGNVPSTLQYNCREKSFLAEAGHVA